MSNNEEQSRPEPGGKAMREIIGYLKNYPFLLITIAGLLILSGILIFETEKLKEFKWLIYAVVLLPLVIQFFIEFKKMQFRQTSAKPAAPASMTSVAPVPESVPSSQTALKLSAKAIASVVIGALLVLTFGEMAPEELVDSDMQTGMLMFAFIALGLGVSAWRDANRQLRRGKGLAIGGSVMGALLALSATGWLMQSQQVQTVSLAGMYSLASYSVNGQLNPFPMSAQMSVGQVADTMYRWESTTQIQPPGSPAISVGYQGVLQNQNGAWTNQVTASNDPNWHNEGPIAVTLSVTAEGVRMQYLSQGNAIVEDWRKASQGM